MAANAQERGRCHDLSYEDKNQIDPPAIRVNRIQGQVTLPSGETVAKICVGVFTNEGEHKLVAGAETDDRGNFGFLKLAPGHYRLVANVPGLCPANASVILQKRRKQRILRVHMRVRGIDDCSFID